MLVFVCSLLFLISCKRDAPAAQKHCWQIIDNVGNAMANICDKTEAELLACVNNGSCGSFTGITPLTSCNYYQTDGPKDCYLINGSVSEEITESQAKTYANCFGNRSGVYTRATCIPCAFWFHRKKSTYKPNNSFTYSTITRQRFCGDTLQTLFPGRQLIIKDDADSLIVIQFSDNGTNWW